MKRKLLFAAVALLCTVGTWAQIDVTSKYLTNPSFETGDMTGWSYLWDNHDHSSIPFAAYGASSAEYSTFSSGGGVAADGNFIAKMGATNWCDIFTLYQSNAVTLPAGSYRLTANLQSNSNLGNYALGIVEGAVSSEAKTVTFKESTSGSFADALKGTTYELDFTLTDATYVTFAATSSMWGENHEFYADNFKLYRLTDVTSAYLQNPSFELKSAGTAQTNVVTSSGGTALSIYGWTENLNGINSLRNSDWVNNSTKGTSSRFSSAITAADGEWHYYARKGWSNSSTKDIALTSNEMTLPRGQYTVSCNYLLEENYRDSDKSQGSFLTLKAMNGNTELSSQKSTLATTRNDEKASYTDTSWKKFSVTFDVAGESLNVQLVLALSPRGGVNTEVHLDNFAIDYSPFADSDDYNDLATAIDKVEAYTLGFDADEYAPYNVLPILTKAKAIDTEANNSQATVRELIDALNTITANSAEVNAIAYGDLSSYETIAGKDYPWGWKNYNDGSRIMGGSEGTNAGLSASSTGKAMLVKYNALYGDNADYTMPLKANTYYTLAFKYCGWGNQPETKVVIKDESSTQLTLNSSSFAPSTSDGDSKADHWYDYKVTFKTGDAGNYTLAFEKVESGQQQIAWADMTLIRATAAEIKPFLQTEIAAANETYKSGANVGTAAFQIPEAAGTAFNTAINTTAQGVYDNASATADDVVGAISDLQTAAAEYTTVKLNSPADGVQYRIKATATAGKSWAGKYYTMAYDAKQTHGYHSINANNDAAEYLAQAWKFTAVDDVENGYTLSMTDENGETRYVCTNKKGYNDGTATQIRTTTDASKALVVKVIAATGTDGRWFLQNTEDNSYIGGQDAGFYSNSQNYDLAIEAATPASVTVSAKAGKYGTVIFPFTPDITGFDGITFYSCAEVNSATNNVMMEAVGTPAANTPYLIKNDGESDFSKALTGYGTAAKDLYTEGLLTGVYTAATIAKDANNYVLQTQDGTQAFYLVSGENDFTATAYKCYLTYSAGGVKAFGLNFNDTPTAINAVEAEQLNNAAIYNLAGQRVEQASRLRSGIYIVGGKKVMVK